MKKLYIIPLVLFAVCTSSTISFAQTATPKPSVSSSPTSISDSTQIEKIKDLVASRVAELKLVEKRGILGTVTQVTSTQITLTDIKNKRRIVDIDEITKFSSPSSKTFGISDIEKGDTLGVVGLLNKGTDHILARFVNTVSSMPTLFDGVITDVDRRNYVVTAVNEKGDKTLIDIETSTKISSYTKDDSMVKSGFSKVSAGERIYVSGFMDDTEKNQLNADRIIHFPELALSDTLKRFADEEVVETTPTAGKSATLTPKPTAAN